MASLPIPLPSLPRTGSGSSTNRCSPATRVATRLVTSRASPAQASSSCASSDAAPGRRCSRLSSTRSIRRGRRPASSASTASRPGSSPIPRACASVAGRVATCGQAGQRHPGHAIGVQPVSLRLDPGDVHHQTGLPDSARAEHRDQPDPGPGQQGPDTADLALTPDQGAVRCRHRGFRWQPRRCGAGPGQHVLVRTLQLLTRVGAQLVAEHRAYPLVGGQRVCLAAATVQRGDQLSPQQLPQRIPGYPPLQLRNQLILPPAGQPGVGPRLHRRQAQLGQPGSLRLGERRSHIGQRLSPPQPQRPAQRIRHHGGVTGRTQTRAQRVLELGRVDPHRRIQAVSTRPRADHVPAQHLAQRRHVHLDDVAGRLRRRIAPQAVDDLIHRHRRTGPQRQQAQQRPRHRRRNRQFSLAVAELHRAQHTDPQHSHPHPACNQ